MLTSAPRVAPETEPRGQPGNEHFLDALLAIVGGTVACLLAIHWLPGTMVDGEHLPMGPDSFYHAARVLDAVANARAPLQFDPAIHAPGGSWVTWPWAYDHALALLVRAVRWLDAERPPMAILVWIPVLWTFVNAALTVAIAAALGLPPALRAVALACFALSPLTQMLHGAGRIDHHYVELTIVLAVAWAGLRWFRNPASATAGAILGVMLGLGHAVHNGLFILQIPVLATLFVLWCRREAPPLRGALGYAAGLLLTTLALLLPSGPFLAGHFSFYELSWFHLYAALGASIGVVALCTLGRTWRGALWLAAIGLAIAAVGAAQVLAGIGFLRGDLHGFGEMLETWSIALQLTEPRGGPDLVSARYGWLVWLLPVSLGLALWWTMRREESASLRFFGVYALFGALMLAYQYRFHYYGSFAIYLPLLIAVHRRWPAGRAAVAAAVASAAIALGAAVPGASLLARTPPLAMTDDHLLMRPVYLGLAEACRQRPGVVLANMHEGHYIRFYTGCAVVANSFIATPQHVRQVELSEDLFRRGPEALLAEAPYVDYVLLRVFASDQIRGDIHLGELRERLLAGDASDVPGFEPLFSSAYRARVGERIMPLARVFAVTGGDRRP